MHADIAHKGKLYIKMKSRNNYEQVWKKYIPVSENTKQCFSKFPLLCFVLEFIGNHHD